MLSHLEEIKSFRHRSLARDLLSLRSTFSCSARYQPSAQACCSVHAAAKRAYAEWRTFPFFCKQVSRAVCFSASFPFNSRIVSSSIANSCAARQACTAALCCIEPRSCNDRLCYPHVVGAAPCAPHAPTAPASGLTAAPPTAFAGCRSHGHRWVGHSKSPGVSKRCARASPLQLLCQLLTLDLMPVQRVLIPCAESQQQTARRCDLQQAGPASASISRYQSRDNCCGAQRPATRKRSSRGRVARSALGVQTSQDAFDLLLPPQAQSYSNRDFRKRLGG